MAPSRKRPTTPRTPADSAALRAALRARLPGRVEAVMTAYAAFAAAPPTDAAPRDVTAHHAACKAALQHADLLVRLLRWAEYGWSEQDRSGQERGGEATSDVEALIARARAALGPDPAGEDDEDDEDKEHKEEEEGDPHRDVHTP